MKFTKKCPLCNSEQTRIILKTKDKDRRNIEFFKNKIFQLRQCKNCKFAYTNPIPANKELEPYYSSNYYTKRNSIIKNLMYKILNRFRYNLTPKKGKKILDIGCGDGSFASYIHKKGFDVTGIEPSEAGSTIASKKGFKIIHAELKNANFKDNQFDTITMWHVIEHVHQSHELIKEIKRILKPNGTLVLAFPNLNSIQFKIARKYTFHLDIPRHIYHFSPESIKYLLKKHDFKIKKIKHLSFEYNNFAFMQTSLNLITSEFNLLYNAIIKRGLFRLKNLKNPSYLFSFIVTLILSPFLFILSFPITILEAILRKGATIIVYAKK